MSKRQARADNVAQSKKPHTLIDTTNIQLNNNKQSPQIKHDLPPLQSEIAPIVSIHRFNKLEKLGEGNYGAVYKALDTITNNIVALKKIKLDDNVDDGCPSTALREASLLQTLKHPNIVCMRNIIYQNNLIDINEIPSLYLVFDHSDSDLRRFIDAIINETKLQPPHELCRYLIYQMMDGLSYMHQNGFLHRDLKPQNILVDLHDCTCKLGDLGLARQYSFPLAKYTHEIATLWYRAPEILLGVHTYTTATDVWSIGCIIAELITGIPLFSGDSEIGQLFLTFQTTGTPTPDNWPDCISLPDYHSTFPQWKKKSVELRMKQLIENKLEYTKQQAIELFNKSNDINEFTSTEYAELQADAISDVIEPWCSMSLHECTLAIDLIEKCIVLDPAKRISCIDALQHPYFHSLNIKQATRESNQFVDALAQRMAKRKR